MTALFALLALVRRAPPRRFRRIAPFAASASRHRDVTAVPVGRSPTNLRGSNFRGNQSDTPYLHLDRGWGASLFSRLVAQNVAQSARKAVSARPPTRLPAALRPRALALRPGFLLRPSGANTPRSGPQLSAPGERQHLRERRQPDAAGTLRSDRRRRPCADASTAPRRDRPHRAGKCERLRSSMIA